MGRWTPETRENLMKQITSSHSGHRQQPTLSSHPGEPGKSQRTSCRQGELWQETSSHPLDE